ncbi:metallophosphatase [Algivirga pacifica]|uniref:Metallophosphatase n=1 Tax=Algivirga pacifica TaxID=1162670 RepID=A0ABP9D198_9BACT
MKRYSRRNFVQLLGKGAAASLLLPTTVLGKEQDLIKLTILHTNDTHSQIEPFPLSHKRFGGKGGVLQRKVLIDQVRSMEKNVLLLDAGDIFQGTPYFNMYKGEVEFRAMSEMKYDAATIGNHDFDNTIEGLDSVLPHASFEFLSANYDFSNTVLDGKVKPYQVYEREGVRIGVFGVGIELDSLVPKACYKETVYEDPIAVAQTYSRKLKEEELCDVVICLSHLGYQYRGDKVSDIQLAEKTKNIDLIIGGHTHTFLEEPSKVMNSEGKEVLITQVGFAGINLGRVDFYFDRKKKRRLAFQSDKDWSSTVVV